VSQPNASENSSGRIQDAACFPNRKRSYFPEPWAQNGAEEDNEAIDLAVPYFCWLCVRGRGPDSAAARDSRKTSCGGKECTTKMQSHLGADQLPRRFLVL